MLTETKFTHRAYADSDVQAVTDLLNLCADTEKLDDNYAPEDLKAEFEHPKLDKTLDLQVWHDEAGNLVAFGQIWRDVTPERFDGHLYLRIHPDYTAGDLTLAVLQWAEARLKSHEAYQTLPTKLGVSCKNTQTDQKAKLEQARYVETRYAYTMERDLHQPFPLYQFPEGHTLDHVKNDEEVAKWVDVFNWSFIDHYNFHPTNFEDHKHWLKSLDYIPELDLVAVGEDGNFNAMCLGWISKSENAHRGVKEGWINTLGTRRGFRKIGLGKNMLLASMHKLKEYGMNTALLGVDTQNPTGALGLYESVGFSVRHNYITFTKQL
jgi:mycothiol synthase